MCTILLYFKGALWSRSPTQCVALNLFVYTNLHMGKYLMCRMWPFCFADRAILLYCVVRVVILLVQCLSRDKGQGWLLCIVAIFCLIYEILCDNGWKKCDTVNENIRMNDLYVYIAGNIARLGCVLNILNIDCSFVRLFTLLFCVATAKTKACYYSHYYYYYYSDVKIECVLLMQQTPSQLLVWSEIIIRRCECLRYCFFFHFPSC